MHAHLHLHAGAHGIGAEASELGQNLEAWTDLVVDLLEASALHPLFDLGRDLLEDVDDRIHVVREIGPEASGVPRPLESTVAGQLLVRDKALHDVPPARG